MRLAAFPGIQWQRHQRCCSWWWSSGGVCLRRRLGLPRYFKGKGQLVVASHLCRPSPGRRWRPWANVPMYAVPREADIVYIPPEVGWGPSMASFGQRPVALSC